MYRLLSPFKGNETAWMFVSILEVASSNIKIVGSASNALAKDRNRDWKRSEQYLLAIYNH